MKRYSLFFALLLMPCALIACSYALTATLFNNTGEDIGVDWEDENVAITANQFGEFHYLNGHRKREVRLSSRVCEYLYYVPPELTNYKPDRRLDRGIQIQVEKDFSIDLLPADYAGDAPASNDTILRREGFPIQPVSRKCY